MEWLNNPWIVGIGASSISAVIISIVSGLLSRRKNQEYLQRTKAVNREIISSLKSGIAEGEIPHHQVIYTLIKSTSRKYDVDPKDVYDAQEIIEDLVKEVMDTSFISSKDKESICNSILQINSEELILDQNISIREYSYRGSGINDSNRWIEKISVWMVLTLAIVLFFVTDENMGVQIGSESTQTLFVMICTIMLFTALLGARNSFWNIVLSYKDSVAKRRDMVNKPREINLSQAHNDSTASETITDNNN